MTATPERNDRPPHGLRAHWLLRRWPTLLGLTLATGCGVLIFRLDADVEFAAGIATMMGVYPAAWALNRPAAAWPSFLVLLAIGLGVLFAGIEPAYVMVVILVLLWVWLLIRGRARERTWFTIETAGIAFFGALTVAAALVDPRLGGVLAGVGFFTHGAWDVFHFVKNRVVNRPWSEMCAVVDFPVGLLLIVVSLAR